MTDRSVVYRLRAEVTQFRAQMAQASASTKKLATDLTALDANGATMRRGLDSTGRIAGRIGLVAAAGLGAAVYAAANFDQAMSNVQAATHESADSMELLRAAALKAGADTAFSATEAAAGVEELAKAGVSTADILGGGLAGALDLAAAGGLEVAQAAEISATALTQFKLAGEDVGHVADLLAAGAGKAQGSVEDMGMALKQSGLVAAQTGLSVEETTGTLAAFASAGLIGSDAGTSFKTMLQSLTPTGAKAKNLMDELGISAYDARGNFVGMTEFAGSLQAGLADLSVEQQNAAMKTIFGSDAVRAASVVFQQGAGGIQEWIDKTNDAGYAAETAATRLDNLKGDLEQLRGSLETALIGAGDGSQSPLRSLTQNLTNAVNAFNDLSPAAKGAVSSLLAITAITGGGLWFTSKVIGGIANAKQAIDQLGISAKTTGRAMSALKGSLALGAAVLVLGEIDRTLDSISDHDFSDVDLGRQLEALAGGEVAGNLGQIGSKLAAIQVSAEGMSSTDKMWGWIPGVSSDAEEAATNIEKIDQALAGMVEGGDSSGAADVFAQVQAQAEAAGVSTETLTKSFDAYNLALQNAGEGGTVYTDGMILQGRVVKSAGLEAARSATRTENLGTAMDQASHAGARLAERMAAQEMALVRSRKAARATANGFITLGDGLDSAKVSLGEWLKQLEDQANALRNFRINAQKAAKQGLDEGLIKSLEEAGPAGALRMRQLANATDAEIDRANRAWRRGQAEIKRYTDAIGGVPKSVTTNVVAKTETAMSKLYELNRLKLDDKYVYVHTVRVGGDGTDFVSGGQRKAAGGLITGPGTGTSDSVPIWASNREYMIKADTVDHYGVAFFNALNAQKFAQGGLIGGGPMPTASAPRVNVGGAQVRVFIDGNEVRSIVTEETSADRTFARGHRRGY